MLSESKYHQKTHTQDHELILAHLEEEIRNNPFAKHRIILKAIKMAASREIQKTILEYFNPPYTHLKQPSLGQPVVVQGF